MGRIDGQEEQTVPDGPRRRLPLRTAAPRAGSKMERDEEVNGHHQRSWLLVENLLFVLSGPCPWAMPPQRVCVVRHRGRPVSKLIEGCGLVVLGLIQGRAWRSVSVPWIRWPGSLAQVRRVAVVGRGSRFDG